MNECLHQFVGHADCVVCRLCGLRLSPGEYAKLMAPKKPTKPRKPKEPVKEEEKADE